MNGLISGVAAAAFAATIAAGSAAAAPLEIRFDNPAGGGYNPASNPAPVFSQGGVSVTATCATTGFQCSLTQNAEGLGVSSWTSFFGFPVPDANGDLDGSGSREWINLVFNGNYRLLRVDFESVTDIDVDLPGRLFDVHLHDESALIIDGDNRGAGRISSALGIAGASANCSGVDEGDSGTECEVDLSALNWWGTSFTFGGLDLDFFEGFRIESIVIEQIPEPMSLALFGSAILGLGAARRRR
jgi:hypothetical protein